MIRKVVNRFVEWQGQKGILQEGQRASYEYAYEVLVCKIVNLLIAVLIAWAFHAWVTVAVLLAVYIPMRIYAGGYHAKSNLGCMAMSALIISMICYAVKYFPAESILYFSVPAWLSSAVLLWILAPVEAVNKPLDPIEVKHYRLRARALFIVGSCIGMLAYSYGWVRVSFTIWLAYFFMVMMLIVGKLQWEEQQMIEQERLEKQKKEEEAKAKQMEEQQMGSIDEIIAAYSRKRE